MEAYRYVLVISFKLQKRLEERSGGGTGSIDKRKQSESLYLVVLSTVLCFRTFYTQQSTSKAMADKEPLFLLRQGAQRDLPFLPR